MKTVINPVFMFVVTVGICIAICFGYLLYDIFMAVRRWWLK